MTKAAALTLAPLRSVQSLRGVAALAVMAFHISQWMAPLPNMAGTPAIGSAGVDLFFVISGLVLWLSVSQRQQTVQQFLMGRAVRVLPAYWLATLVVAGLVLIDPKSLPAAQFEPVHLLLSLGLIPHLNPAGQPFPILPVGWSLTYEALFYLVIAASLWRPRARRLVFVAMSLIGVLMIGLASSAAAFLFANPMLMEFILGLLIAQALLTGKMPAALACAALLALGLGLFVLQGAAVTDSGFWRALVWGLPAALVVAGAVGLETAGRWPRLALMEGLGEISYSLYLVHWPVVWLVGRAWHGPHGLAYGAAVTGLSLAAAWLFWRVIDRPAQKALKSRFELAPAKRLPIVAT